MSEVYVGWGNDSDGGGSDAYSSSDDRDAVAPDPSSADDAFRLTYSKDHSLPSLTPSSTADADEGGSGSLQHLSEEDVADLTKWDGRVQRGIVYGREYEPTEEERAEMEELAKSLGVAPRGKRTSLSSALRPQGNEPRSILLKRGLVTLLGDGSAATGDSPPSMHEKELILITNALVVTPVAAQPDKAGGSSARNILATTNQLFHVSGLGNLAGLPFTQSSCGAKECIALSSVLAVMDLAVCVSPTSLRVVDPLGTEGGDGAAAKASAADGATDGTTRREPDDEADDKSSVGDDDDDAPVGDDTASAAVDGEVSFRVVVADVDGGGINGGGRRSFTFACPTRQHKEAWLHALDAAVVGSRLRDGAAEGEEREKGWTHKIVRATLYSAAVLGDVEMLHKIVSRSPEMSVCIPDQLGYTATHYAAMYGHIGCLAMLLGAGADPDGKDSDMMSPIDYASQRRDRKALELFDFNGGTLSAEDMEWVAPDCTEWSPKEGTKMEKSGKAKKGKKKLFGRKGKKAADETDTKAQKDEALASNSYDAEDLPSESENVGPPDEGGNEKSPKTEGKKTFGLLTSKARRRESAELEEKDSSEPDGEEASPSDIELESSRMEGQDTKKVNESKKKFGFSPMKRRSGKNKKMDEEKHAAHDGDGSLSDTGTDDLQSSVASHESKKTKGGRKAFGLMSNKRNSGGSKNIKLEEINVEVDEDVDVDADVDEVSLSELGEIFDDMEVHDTEDAKEGKKSFGLFKKKHSNKNLKAEDDASGSCADAETSLCDTDAGDMPQDTGSKEKEKPNGEGKRFGLRLSNKTRTATDAGGTERPPSPPADDELQSPAGNVQDDLNKWENRVAREDVYRCDYMPSEEEEHEVDELALFMRVSEKKKSMQKKRSTLQSVLRPLEDEPRSIILKRGLAAFEFGKKDVSSKQRSTGTEEKELVLLTNAVVIAPPSIPPSSQLGEEMSPLSPSRKGKNILSATNKLMKKKTEKCMYLKSILAVMDLAVCSPASLKVDYVKENSESESDDDSEESDDDNSEEDIDNESAFRIVVESGSYTFRCHSATEKDLWLHALEVAIVEAHLRYVEAEELLDKGWNHKILRSTMYSAAICGDADMLYKIVSGSNKTKINAQDQRGYSALHYAAMKGNNGCLAVLLDAGAKPNAKDTDKMSPVDYASKRRNRRALEMLKANGGRLSKDDKEWIESVARAAEGNAAKSPDRSASGAVSAMSEAMSQMNERGEKLNELHGKTANLMDAAANYKDFASQLKKKTKEESKFFGVL